MDRLVTVATESHREGLEALSKSLTRSGYGGEIEVHLPSDELWDPGSVVDQPVQVISHAPWYKKFHPEPKVSRDGRHVKCCVLDHLNDGDRIIFCDGGDVIFFEDPSPLFETVSDEPFAPTVLEHDKECYLVPGYPELFGIREVDHYVHSGMWIARVCEDTRKLFRLWKAFSAWSIEWGGKGEDGINYSGGDMRALNFALPVSDIPYNALNMRWNWLPEYPVHWQNGRPTYNGHSLCALRGAGTMHTDYDRAFAQLMGRRPSNMVLEEDSQRWVPEGDEISSPPATGSLDRPALLELRGERNLVGVEVGVDKAANAEHMLQDLDIRQLILIDPWENAPDLGSGEPGVFDDREKAKKAHQEAKRRLEPYQDKVAVIDQRIEDIDLKPFPPLDFVYIDGNHSEESTAAAIKKLAPLLKGGGLLAGHDYGAPGGVKEAVDRLIGDVNHAPDLAPGEPVREDWWVRNA